MAAMFVVLVWLAFASQTVRQDQYPLRSGCLESDPVLGHLQAGEPLQVKFGLAGAARPCFLVVATLDGKTVEGYVPGDALTGLEEFERARRAAPSVLGGGGPTPAFAPPAVSRTPNRPSSSLLPAGAPVADFAFTDFSGGSRRLSDFGGRYVLLDFWASWCGPCRREVPFLKEAYATYRSRGFEILGMDADDDHNRAARYVSQEGIPWPQATARSIRDVMHQQFGVRAFPSTFLLDPQRRIIPLPAGAVRGRNLLATLDRVLR